MNPLSKAPRALIGLLGLIALGVACVTEDLPPETVAPAPPLLEQNLERINSILPTANREGWGHLLIRIRNLLHNNEALNDQDYSEMVKAPGFGARVCAAFHGESRLCSYSLVKGGCPNNVAALQPNHIPEKCTLREERVPVGIDFGLFLLGGGNLIDAHRYRVGLGYSYGETLCMLTGFERQQCFDLFGVTPVGECIMETHNIEKCRDVERYWKKRITGQSHFRTDWTKKMKPIDAEPEVYREAGLEPPSGPFTAYKYMGR
jgi:hypothetical protein